MGFRLSVEACVFSQYCTFCATLFSNFIGQVSSLSHRNSYVCSYAKLYLIITKLIVVFKSRPENLQFDLHYNAGDYHNTRVGTLIVATIYLQMIQNRYMFRSFTVLQCSHQHCVQSVASDLEVVGYL